jgi:hypothetical protein
MATDTTHKAPVAPAQVPPLRAGDRLTLDEFLRRYEAIPEVHNAQLIEGVVYMPSPVTHIHHGNPHFNLIGWLFSYALQTPGVEGGDNSTLKLDVGSGPQADAYLIVRPSHGGRVRIDEGGYIVGGPELVAEVAPSSASIDLGDKLSGYQRNGVCEYVVWRVLDRAVDWFVLRGSSFELLAPSPDGVLRSEVFAGLWLDPAALLAGNMPVVVQRVQLGTASPEHAAFVARLQQAAALETH